MEIFLIEISEKNPFQNHIDNQETSDCIFCTIDELEHVIKDIGGHGDSLKPVGSKEFEVKFREINGKLNK